MADTLTTNIRLTNQTEGGNNNSWGTIADANFETLDNVLGDTTDITTTGGDTTLTNTQELVANIQVAGTLVSNATITFSGRGGFWIIDNNTSGDYTLTCLVSGQTGVEITQGSAALVFCDGTDILYGNPQSDLAINGFDAITAPAVGDLAVVADADDSYGSKKITLANLFKVIDALTAETAPAIGDEVAIYDADGATTDKMTLANLLKVVNGLTADASPDSSADYLLTYDADAAAAKKVLPDDLTVGNATLAAAAPGTLLGLVEERQSAGVSGGSGTNSAWTTAVLNEETYDRNNIISIASNQFTLSTAGTYEIEWMTPSYSCEFVSRLQNITSGSAVDYGTPNSSAFGDRYEPQWSKGWARVTIAGSTAFAIQYYKNGGYVGRPANQGSAPEIYTRVVIRKG